MKGKKGSKAIDIDKAFEEEVGEETGRNLMKDKLLVICGPTATGKTRLALYLAEVFGGELVSADSRQVYKGMDVGTGKDLPKNAKFQQSKIPSAGGYYKVGGVRVWGYDLVEPSEEFSVGQYIRIARGIIKDIWKRGKLPILVGGTGLYIKGVVDGISTASIPRNQELRRSLEGKSATELFEILTKTDPVKVASLNISDKKNPRRLSRAIEVAKWRWEVGGARSDKSLHIVPHTSILFIGLTASKEVLDRRIEKRIGKRIKLGIENEIRELLARGVKWDSQSMQSLGYKQWQEYFEIVNRKAGNTLKNSYLLSRSMGNHVGYPTVASSHRRSESTGRAERKEVVIEKWKRAEKQYVKRQITWFKRDKRINWFDITKPSWRKSVEKLVGGWYSSKRN